MYLLVKWFSENIYRQKPAANTDVLKHFPTILYWQCHLHLKNKRQRITFAELEGPCPYKFHYFQKFSWCTSKYLQKVINKDAKKWTECATETLRTLLNITRSSSRIGLWGVLKFYKNFDGKTEKKEERQTLWHKISTEVTSIFVQNNALTQTSLQDIQVSPSRRKLGTSEFLQRPCCHYST